MTNGKSLGSNLIWNSAGTTFYFGCQWLLTVVVVHFSGGYSDAGVLSLAMSISSPLCIVANQNLRTFQVSELEGRFRDGEFLANRVLTSAAALIICAGVIIYKGYDRYAGLCIMVFMLFKVSEALADVFHGMDQRKWRLDIAGKSFFLRGFALLIAMGCGMIFGGSLLLTILIMAISVYLIIFFYDVFQCRNQVKPDLSYRWRRVVMLFKVGIPLALSSLFLNLISTYPRIQIETQYGQESLGIYASISTPTFLITQLSSFIFSPLMGLFAECREKRDKKGLYKLLLISGGGIVIIGAAALVMSNVLGEWVLVRLFGDEIGEYVYLLIPIVYTAILTAIIWLLYGLLTVFDDYKMLTALTLIAWGVCFLISSPWIAVRQLMGAVLALLAALMIEVLLLIMRLVYLLRRERLLF